MRTLAFVSLLALAGCGSKKEPAKTTDTGSGSAGSGSAVAKPADGPAAAAAKGTNLTLPKGDGTPPKQSSKALDKADFDKLSKHEFPGFKPIVRKKDNELDVRHATDARPILATTVNIAPCFDCLPMELDKWKAKEAGLKMLLSEELRDRADTTWELGTTELHGQPLIFTYQFGYNSGKDDQDNPELAYSNAYALYFSDGKNQIRVVAEYKDDPVTREDLKSIAPREDLEKLAKGFMDFYTHAW